MVRRRCFLHLLFSIGTSLGEKKNKSVTYLDQAVLSRPWTILAHTCVLKNCFLSFRVCFFFFLVINLVKLRGLFGVLFSTRACVRVCMSSVSIHFSGFWELSVPPGRFEKWREVCSLFFFSSCVCVCVCAKGECGSETFCSSWDALTFLYHTLFFPWHKNIEVIPHWNSSSMQSRRRVTWLLSPGDIF